MKTRFGRFIVDKLFPFLFGGAPYDIDYYMQAPYLSDPIPEENENEQAS